MIVRLAKRDLATKFGVFSEILYYDGQAESIALVAGDVAGKENVLCRIHSACIAGHVFNSVECECANEMAAAQRSIEQAGCGVIIYLDQEGKGNGHLALMQSIPYKGSGHSQAEAYEKAGFEADARNYGPAAEILIELRVSSIVLLSGNSKKSEGLSKRGIRVVDHPI